MKRFWTRAEAVPDGQCWTIELDGKPVRTPARASLTVPTRELADAIAGEWNSVDAVDPARMPLTGLANAAIDRVAPDASAFAAGLARYAQNDLLCYRAERPKELVARQSGLWDPLIAWARRRYDIDLQTTCGILHVDQPKGAAERLAHEVAVLDPYRLAGLSPIVTLGGSLIGALAVLEGELEPARAWDAFTVDDRWQIEQWGSDSEAEARLANRERDFLSAARFLALLEA